ncbi:folate-binding protein YgfZ [soil metagenome]
MGADDNHPMTITMAIDGAVRLTHWGLIRARGEEAAKFLQGQLTNDVASLTTGQARLAGFCSAKGRLQASFLVWKAADGDLMLACSASVLPATLKRLSMFVMRSKCKLSDASSELALWGFAGAPAAALAGDLVVGAARDADGATVIRLPDAAGSARALSIVSADALPSAPAIALDAWRWLEVQAGIPIIEAATVDQFVPQMLNYELIGGVDFQKGCYPGQEIVARSQYRGTIKRRMFLFEIDGVANGNSDAGHAPAAGQEVFHSSDAEQPAGMVVNAAPRPGAAGFGALVEVKSALLDSGSLHLGAAGGALLRRTELPYTLPAEVTAPA